MIDKDLAERLDELEARFEQPSLSLERKIGIGALVAIIIQAALGVWWVSKLDSQVEANTNAAAEARALTIAEVARLAQIVADNREWQIEQRVRVWDRIRDQSLAIDQMSRNMAAQLAMLEAVRDEVRETKRSVDRLVERLLDQRQAE